MGQPGDLTPAEEVFAGWLARREVGEAEASEELERAHPDLASELAELEGEWRAVRSRLDDLDDPGDPDESPLQSGNGGRRTRPTFATWLRKVLGRGPPGA